jgi:hypothetical protein
LEVSKFIKITFPRFQGFKIAMFQGFDVSRLRFEVKMNEGCRFSGIQGL